MQSLRRTNAEFRWKASPTKPGVQVNPKHVEILYDPIATTVTEAQDMDYNVFAMNDKELNADINMDSSDFKHDLARMKIESEKNKIQSKSTKLIRSLYEDIKTENDQLKYEYIEMVKNGKRKGASYVPSERVLRRLRLHPAKL